MPPKPLTGIPLLICSDTHIEFRNLTRAPSSPMHTSLLPVALMAVISLICSCVPAPSTTEVFPAIRGTVVDTKGRAIPGALVVAERAGFVRQGRSSRIGEFKLMSAVQMHYALVSGPPGVKPPPWFWQRERELTPLTLTASAPGFEPATMTIPCIPKVPFLIQLPSIIQIPLVMSGGHAVAVPE
jgi:hypothetical protein